MTKIVVDDGIIILLDDGTIINFPEGNDKDYHAWLGTDEADRAWLMLSGKAAVLSHMVEVEEANNILEELVDNQDVMDELYFVTTQAQKDRIAGLYCNPKSTSWAPGLMAKWRARRDEQIEDAKRQNARQSTLEVN